MRWKIGIISMALVLSACAMSNEYAQTAGWIEFKDPNCPPAQKDQTGTDCPVIQKVRYVDAQTACVQGNCVSVLDRFMTTLQKDDRWAPYELIASHHAGGKGFWLGASEQMIGKAFEGIGRAFTNYFMPATHVSNVMENMANQSVLQEVVNSQTATSSATAGAIGEIEIGKVIIPKH